VLDLFTVVTDVAALEAGLAAALDNSA